MLACNSRQRVSVLLLMAATAAGTLPTGPAAAQRLADPQTVERLHHRGMNYKSLGEHSLAIADFDAALSIDPGHAPARVSRGYVYLEQGQETRALQDFNVVLQTADPSRSGPYNHASAYIGRGQIALRRKAYDQAVVDFSEALQRHRMSTAAYAHRAEALLEQGKLAQALADVDRAIWVDRQYSPAYRIRAVIYRAQERPLEAAKDAMQAGLFEAFEIMRGLLVRARDKTQPIGEDLTIGPGPPSPIPLGTHYPSMGQACADGDRVVLWISMGAGMAAVRPMYAGTGGAIAVLQNASGMTFWLGDESCRMKVTIASATDRNDAKDDAQPLAVARNAQAPLFEHRFYEPSPACVAATLRVRAFWGYVDLVDETMLSPHEHRWNNPRPAPDVASHRFGDTGCEIEIRISKAG